MTVTLFRLLQDSIVQLLSANRGGLSQAAVARYLGIPREDDNNWITYYLLQTMQKKGLVVRDDQKLFHLTF